MSNTDMNLNCQSVQARLAASWGYVKPSAVRAGYFAYDAEHNIWEEVSSADAPGAMALYMVGDTPETSGAAAIKLPIDVTIGCGTIKAGCSLQTLLTRIEIINQTWQPKALADHIADAGKPIAEPVTCACGDIYPADSFGAGFIAALGHCQNCDAVQPVQEPVAWLYDWEHQGEIVTGWVTQYFETTKFDFVHNVRPLYAAPVQPVKQGPVALSFPRDTTSWTGGWTIDHELVLSIDDAIDDNEFKPCLEGMEQVLLALEKVYAAPVERQWVDLTDDELGTAMMPIEPTGKDYFLRLAHAVIAAFKEKNK